MISNPNEKVSITSAIAVAPGLLNCSNLLMIATGAISVFIGKLPEIKTTEPYSPTPLANASAKPVSKAGAMVGRITR